MNPVLATEHPYGGDFHVPSAGEIFNLPPLFEIAGLEVTRPMLLVVLAVLIAVGFMTAAFANPKIVPGKVQMLGEMLIEFIHNGIALDVIGEKGKHFTPFLTGIFLFVFINNFFEVMPFVNFPPASRIAVPAGLALVTYIVFVGTGLRYQGFGYIKDTLFPPGVPWPVYILLTPIEFVSAFILRPVTLTIRLFANMVAGHILLTIVFLATHAFFRIPGLVPEGSNLLGFPIGLITLLLGPVAVAFEMFVGTLQAYIFAILAAVYISGSVESHH